MTKRTIPLGLIVLAVFLAVTSQTAFPKPEPVELNKNQRPSALRAGVMAADRPGTGMLYGRPPLHFEENRGQTDSQVKFLARAKGCALFLSPAEVVLDLRRSEKIEAAKGAGLGKKSKAAALRIRLIRSGPEPQVIGLDRHPGTVNYFVGRDPKKWRTNIPTYAKVAYKGVYSGIDLVWRSAQGRVEYDFVVAPGADPKSIRLVFQGMDRLGLNKDGALVLSFPGGEVVQPAPVMYQEDKGKRRPVSGGYVLLGQNQVGFDLADYDRSRPLIIDPVLVYSTYLGGSGDETGWSIAVDSSGAAYVAGETDSLDFPQAGLQGAFGGGETDSFVAKLNPSGTALVYATYLGGSGIDAATSLTVDSSGAVYVTGYTDSNDFPLQSPGQGFLSGLEDVFVTKLNPSGSALVFSTYLGGGLEDRAMGIAVDSSGAVYITGFTRSVNYPVTGGVIQGGLGGFGHYDAFVTKLNNTASALFYSTYLGGGGDDYGQGLGLDSSGNAYVAGHTDSADFPTAAAYQDSLAGGRDAFAAKLNDTGTALIYSTYLGGGGDDDAQALAVYSSGSAYVIGSTGSQDFPTAGYQNSFGGQSDAFVTRFNTSGQTLVYSTYLGGSGDDFGSDIALDSSGNAYLAGFTNSTDFPEAGPSQALFGGGTLDGFAVKLNFYGTALIYSTYIGGSGSDSVHGIAVDNSGNAYVTGNAESADFPTTGYQVLFGGGDLDSFVLKIDADPDTVPPTVTSSSPADKKTGINVTTSISATFSEPMDPDTINTDTFTLSLEYAAQDSGVRAGPIEGTVTYEQATRTATFIPAAKLDHISWYVAAITPGAKDLAGNGLAEGHVINFATANPELVSGSGGCFISLADSESGPFTAGAIEIMCLLFGLFVTGLMVRFGERPR